MRVSCLQSGTLDGQQPFRAGLGVVEHQEPFWGCTPLYGEIGITMRGEVTARSMFAFWLSGIEDRPERSGEICVAEIFGSSVDRSSAEVGIGLHAFRDPGLEEDFTTQRHSLDVSDFHDYVVAWSPGSLEFTIDDRVVRRLSQAPDYPVQLMIGVFDFPERAVSPVVPIPLMEVQRVWVRPARFTASRVGA
ncbi:MAG TPA: glycoside hydrolase family 16 protein [Acidimicrobiia bacterium]